MSKTSRLLMQRLKTVQEMKTTEQVRSVAERPSNSAGDIATSDKIGFHLIAAVADRVEPRRKVRFVQPKKKSHGFRVEKVKTILYRGQEVKCRVLSDEPAYFTGKVAPSGKPPGGTYAKDDGEYDRKSNRHLLEYLQIRAETTHADRRVYDEAAIRLKLQALAAGVDLTERQ